MKLSTAVITYNQRPYIEQALQSVLSQKTEFSHEIVVGEDYSTDGTRERVQELARQNPGKIRLELRASNTGMGHNFLETLRACRGEYIALLEGDDYWIDDLKLSKMTAFLDSHPDYSMTFHAVNFRHEEDGTEEPSTWLKNKKPVFLFEDLCQANFIATGSVVLRRSALPEFPGWLYRSMPLDWILFLLLAQKGPVGYLDETLGVYRIHKDGIWSSKTKRAKARFAVPALLNYASHAGPKISGPLHQTAARLFFRYVRDAETLADLKPVSETIRLYGRLFPHMTFETQQKIFKKTAKILFKSFFEKSL